MISRSQIALRKIATIITTISTVLVAASICLACDCNNLSPPESFKAADLVFVGSVVTLQSSAPDGTSNVMNATFRVEQVLKGTPAGQVVITSHMSDCDVSFQNGYGYIVYALQAKNGRFFASTCMSTRALPTPDVQEPIIRSTSRPRIGYRATVVGVILLLALVGGFIVGRAWPRSA